MKSRSVSTAEPGAPVLLSLFTGGFGVFLGLTLLKFGSPVIMEKYLTLPENAYEWVLNGWPAWIGSWLLVALLILGWFTARWQTGLPKILVVMPLAWLGWQALAGMRAGQPAICGPTVVHFGECAACFYLGLFCLGRVEKPIWFWAGILAGFALVLCAGIRQHFGGLEETRRYWLLYLYPNLKEIPPGFMKKMSSNRIFATLFYPNTLAGIIIMVLPMMLAVIWSWQERFTKAARAFLMGAGGLAALACLYWSGSKGGWLLMLGLGLIAGLWLPFQRRTKLLLAGVVLVLGLAGFFIKYLIFFEKGATSVVARFDYWEAALKTAQAHPLFGSGPGTFGKMYERLKRPESEMAQLAHNDYLQQASDSGIPGFLTFVFFVAGTLVYTWRKTKLREDGVKLAVWLGLLGWAVQSFFEFGLYIPAVGWLAFAWMGWLLRQCRIQIDSRAARQ